MKLTLHVDKICARILYLITSRRNSLICLCSYYSPSHTALCQYTDHYAQRLYQSCPSLEYNHRIEQTCKV